jgi:hypothetical protein
MSKRLDGSGFERLPFGFKYQTYIYAEIFSWLINRESKILFTDQGFTV